MNFHQGLSSPIDAVLKIPFLYLFSPSRIRSVKWSFEHVSQKVFILDY